MKTLTSKIEIPVTWKFSSDGTLLESSVVGGKYQAEIWKSTLSIYLREFGSPRIREVYCHSRERGIRLASRLFAELLNGAK